MPYDMTYEDHDMTCEDHCNALLNRCRKEARLCTGIAALALDDRLLTNPYAAGYRIGQGPLIDCELAGGRRFRLYAEFERTPANYEDALKDFEILDRDLGYFRAMPELWGSDDKPHAILLAFEIVQALDDHPHEILDPKLLAAAWFQPSEAVR